MRYKRTALAAAVAAAFAVPTALVAADAPAPAPVSSMAEPPSMTAQEKEVGAKIYFERCAGCHGMLRKGATGKNLEPKSTLKLGQNRLEKIITLGTEGGMVNHDDILTKEEITTVSKYIQNTPEQPPEWGMKEMMASWKVIVPPDQRPKKKMNKYNINNVFSVTLRDAGQVALIDGDTKEIINIVKTGYAVHISRLSASGRYVYTIGRDGLLNLIDLWMEKPDIVAVLKSGLDARSVDTSKFKGYEDKYAIVGSYWPPQYVILEGDTLKPLKIVSTRSIGIDGQYHPEPRVASIVSSPHKPEWVVNVKETGLVKLVDYSDIKNLKEVTIESSKFLHDGGWDASKRYFLVAANMSNQVVAVDTKTGKLAAIIDTKSKPHPGRGANFTHPKFGPVWATSHLGSDVITLIGTDPEKHKAQAWKVVQELKNHGGGSLFIKTHPKSNNMWVDAPLNPEKDVAESLTVYDIKNLDKGPEVINIAKAAGLPETKSVRRVVHGEYNQKGDEVWFSIWTAKTEPGFIVIMDDKTRKVKKVLNDPRLVTPTGKFNVANTTHDIY
jgi:nitrite reductase (NO-forming)/hydroxylamine reductase